MTSTARAFNSMTASKIDDLVGAAKLTVQKVERLIAAMDHLAAGKSQATAAFDLEAAARHARTMLLGAIEALRDAVDALEHPNKSTQATPADAGTER